MKYQIPCKQFLLIKVYGWEANRATMLVYERLRCGVFCLVCVYLNWCWYWYALHCCRVLIVLICVDGGVGGGWRLDVVGVEMGGEEVGGMWGSVVHQSPGHWDWLTLMITDLRAKLNIIAFYKNKRLILPTWHITEVAVIYPGSSIHI